MGVDDPVRGLALGLLAVGVSLRSAARRTGVPVSRVAVWARLAGMQLARGRLGGVESVSVAGRRRAREPVVLAASFVDANGRLSLSGRIELQVRRGEGWSMRRIAERLGVNASTVCREVNRVGMGAVYYAEVAEHLHRAAMLRPKPLRLASGSRLRAEVVARLNDKHSPQQVAARLKLDHPDRHDRWVSHETIYQALYVQGAGSLRHELTVEKALRQGRTSRRPQSRLTGRTAKSWIGDATITNRPPEAADRVPGHWEGDLVIGGDKKSALITLNERGSRYTLVSRITCHDTTTVTQKMIQMMQGLPASMLKSLTWDQGVEMAGHANFTVATGCPVYFCDPHSPWQRPTNENSNGLIRDFFPKGTNFTHITDEQVDDMERLLNSRPRKILQWQTPAERLQQQITVAATP